MRRLSAVALLVCSAAHAQLVVDEASTRAKLVNGRTAVSLALDNRSGQPLAVRVGLEWVDPKDRIRSAWELRQTVPAGKSMAEAGLPVKEGDDGLFYRLRYSVQPDAANLTAFTPARGIVSLPGIADHAFILSAMGVGTLARPGRPYEFRVFAAHPITNKPAPGVRVSIDKVAATTDAEGAAVLRISPDDPDDWESGETITIEGCLGDIEASTEAWRPPLARSTVLIYTDKPLYQPGQTAHVRILARGGDGRARPDAAYTIRFLEQGSTVAYSSDVTTSRFGVAHADWEIPPGAEAGKYSIEVKDDDYPEGRRVIEVRRYELPSFRVTAAPSRPFYLRGQVPEVEIHGDYLFGKPVPGGKVKITETDDDKALREGVLDASGHFRASLQLEPDDDRLENARFEDLHYTAYVTDPTTNRTEQRRFDIRISRDPVHVYVIRGEPTTMGTRLFVSAYIPDGTPAAADIEVLSDGNVVGSAQTNRFGLARIDVPPGKDNLAVRARTAGGTATEDVGTFRRSPAAVRLETDQALYRAGQPIRCHIRADRDTLAGVLMAWREDGQVLYARSIQLRNFVADAVIPYSPAFRGVFVAFLSARGAPYETGRAVLYPGAEDLHITAKPGHDTYRPGERASLSFQASTGGGAPVEAALGIAVVDQAVFERAETDRASERRRWFGSGDEFSYTRIGGLTGQDLIDLPPEKIDASYQLVAEALLDAEFVRPPATTFLEDQQQAFASAAAEGLAQVKKSLDAEYGRTLNYPTDQESLMAAAGYALETARDPWDQPYREKFSIEGPHAVLSFLSAGPDKTFDTEDDMVALTVEREWFRPFQAAIASALTGLKDYPATTAEFAALLDESGIRLDHLRDPWKNPLRAVISHRTTNRTIEIVSSGPDHALGTQDDFTVAIFSGTYFRAMQEKIEQALRAAPAFPTDESEFRAVLSAAGLDLDGLRDPWGHRYFLTFQTDAHFADRTELYLYQEYQGLPEQRKKVVPIKFTYCVIEIRSDGEDGVRGTYDDFTVAGFTRFIEENPPPIPAPTGKLPSVTLGGRGAIIGIVTDPTGGEVANVEVTLADTYVTRTDKTGHYYFRGVPPGAYIVVFYTAGFQKTVYDRVPVQADRVTSLDAVLRLGIVSESVTVEAAASVLMTDSAQASEVQQQPDIGANYTPHVRDYFPETLLWNPELITDTRGNASLDFKLADNITTWHVAVIGSTVDGRIAEGSADIKAFQPFFVDLDPPQVLTVADEIALPVPIRNYLETSQAVSVEVKTPPALEILDAPKKPEPVDASSSLNFVVRMRASGATAAAPLRVTARSREAADAIEKPVAIHPDGEPVSRTVSDIVEAGRLLRIDVPADAIPGSMRAEVKLYPGLMAHVIESMTSLLGRPWGCGEQTISSSYPNLMFLRALKEAGLHNALEDRARRNLNSGYQRLLGYRTSEGGIAYWAKDAADIALTAYAIAFLEDAKDLIAIDEDVLDGARAWLSRQDPKDLALRGVALRALATAGPQYEKAVVTQLGELARTAASMDEPYTIAAFALAAMDAAKPELAAGAIDRLRSLAHDEQGMKFWGLQRNTPYYGWGRAGGIEATALALTALSRWRKHAGADPQLDALIDGGTLFLLRNKDKDGLWLSTQATIRVFAALLDTLNTPGAARTEPVEVFVNGVSAGRANVPGGRSIQGPVTLDVARFLKPGVANEVSLQTPSGRLGTQAQFTASWYEKWKGPRTSDQLALRVHYSATEAAPNQPVQCEVTVSRPSFRGYGMMIAEVGLPPGAEVDRGTLDDAKVDSYEVAPDHVTFYVWPNANDSKFSFTFRPRYPIRAMTAPSVLYDYYNPDARVVLPPVSLVVK